MTPTTSEQKARELLAQQYENAGLSMDAEALRHGLTGPHGKAIRAIIAALTRPEAQQETEAQRMTRLLGDPRRSVIVECEPQWKNPAPHAAPPASPPSTTLTVAQQEAQPLSMSMFATRADFDAAQAKQEAQGTVALPPMQAPVPTVEEARERIDIALSDAQKALAVLSTMLKKEKLMQGYAVTDEILGNLGFARKLHATLPTPPVPVNVRVRALRKILTELRQPLPHKRSRSEIADELSTIVDGQPTQIPKLGITMEGGIIQSAFSNTPIEFSVIDYDTDGADEDELSLVPQNDGHMEEAYFHQPHVEIMPEEFTGRLANIKSLKPKEEEP